MSTRRFRPASSTELKNIPSSYTSQKWFEVQKYIAVTYHTHTGYAAIMNKTFWDGLPADLKTHVNAAMSEATAHEEALVAKENDDALKTMQASGKTQIKMLSADEKAVWKSALNPVIAQMSPRIGDSYVQAARKAADAA